jgi:serpin B
VDEITHEAVIDVNEKGCEAAAYTMIDMAPNCPAPDQNQPFVFKADRPFFYFITNTEGVPVFMGIVNDPNQK